VVELEHFFGVGTPGSINFALGSGDYWLDLEESFDTELWLGPEEAFDTDLPLDEALISFETLDDDCALLDF